MKKQLVLVAVLLGSVLLPTPPSSSAAEPESQLDRATKWEVTIPGLEIVAPHLDGYVVNSDNGPKIINIEQQQVTDLNLGPVAESILVDKSISCEPDQITTHDWTNEWGRQEMVSAEALGFDAIVDCFFTGLGLVVIAESAGDQQLWSFDVPSTPFGPDPILANPVHRNDLADAASLDAGPARGLIITTASGDRFWNPEREWAPVPYVEGDGFHGRYIYTRTGDQVVETDYLFQPQTYTYNVPAAAVNITSGPLGRIFAVPTNDGGSRLVTRPEYDPEVFYSRELKLPFVPDFIHNRDDNIGTALSLQHNDTLYFLAHTNILLSQSSDVYDVSSDEPITVRLWGLEPNLYNMYDQTGRSLPRIELVAGGFEFFPLINGERDIVVRDQVSDTFTFSYQLTGSRPTVPVTYLIDGPAGESHYLTGGCGHRGIWEDFNGLVEAGDELTFQAPVGGRCAGNSVGNWGPIVDGEIIDHINYQLELPFVDSPATYGFRFGAQGAFPVWLSAHKSPSVAATHREVQLVCERDNVSNLIETFIVEYGAGPTRYELTWREQMRGWCTLRAAQVDGASVPVLTAHGSLEPPAYSKVGAISVFAGSGSWTDVFDGDLNPLNSDDEFGYQQFRDILDRQPSDTEWREWTIGRLEGTSAAEQTAELLALVTHTDMTEPNIRLYQAYFNRIPDSAGLAYWIDVRRQGYSIDLVSDQFSLSREFQLKYANTNNSDFARLVYENVLKRDPDGSGFDYWVDLLDTDQITRGQMMIYFSESVEYKRDTSARVDVIDTYITLLRRSPTEMELADETLVLTETGSLVSLIERIHSSDEYAERF